MPTPYLNFDGTTAEAFAFYERALGATNTQVMTFGASPMAGDVPEAFHGRAMHAVTTINGERLMASDTGPWAPFEGSIRSCAVSVQFDTAEAAEQAFAALCDGGTVTMPLDKSFWAERFGMVTDRFGVPWMIGTRT